MMGKFRATVSWTRTPGPQGFLVHRAGKHDGRIHTCGRPLPLSPADSCFYQTFDLRPADR